MNLNKHLLHMAWLTVTFICISSSQALNLPPYHRESVQSLARTRILHNSASVPAGHDRQIKTADTVGAQHLTIYSGAGWVNGLRVGLSYQFTPPFSFEASFGNNVTIIGGATLREVYAFGINHHTLVTDHIGATLLISYIKLPTNAFVHSWIVSPNLGFVPFDQPGVHAFVRAGVFIEFKQSGDGRTQLVGPNLDLGIAWTLF